VETGFPEFTTFSVGEAVDRRTVVCFQQQLLDYTLGNIRWEKARDTGEFLPAPSLMVQHDSCHQDKLDTNFLTEAVTCQPQPEASDPGGCEPQPTDLSPAHTPSKWALGSDKKVPAASRAEQERLREAIKKKEEDRRRRREEMSAGGGEKKNKVTETEGILRDTER